MIGCFAIGESLRYVSVQISTALAAFLPFEKTICFNFKAQKAENDETAGSKSSQIALVSHQSV